MAATSKLGLSGLFIRFWFKLRCLTYLNEHVLLPAGLGGSWRAQHSSTDSVEGRQRSVEAGVSPAARWLPNAGTFLVAGTMCGPPDQ